MWSGIYRSVETTRHEGTTMPCMLFGLLGLIKKPVVLWEVRKLWFDLLLDPHLWRHDVWIVAFIAGSCMVACPIYCVVWRSQSRQIIKRHWGPRKNLFTRSGTFYQPTTGWVPVARNLAGLYKKREEPTSFSLFILKFREGKVNTSSLLRVKFPRLLLSSAIFFISKFFLLSRFTSIPLSVFSVLLDF